MASETSGSSQAALQQALDEFEFDPGSPHPRTVQMGLHLARRLQTRAVELQSPQERRQQTELDLMIQNPHDKATLTQMTDQAFRSTTAHRAVDQLVHILDVQGVPRFFSPLDRTLLIGFQSFGSYLPGVAVPMVKEKMRRETANVILPAEASLLREHLSARRDEGVRMNVNFLGEALLGEAEAKRRLQAYLQALQMPEIEVISVKISTIYSQISALAREHTISELCDRMELLYRAAAKERFVRGDGSETSKFVYMDMEEYRDMSLTAETFMRTLDRKGLENVRAGIVLQAYIPDAFRMQQRINQWARRRVSEGGCPITMRIVKGANMEMERVEASLCGWPQAPYKSKVETDANYKRMLHEGLKPENLAAVQLGVASHNLFDAAYALALAVEHGAVDQIQFEMLEGMANHQRRALFELTDNLLLYAPACRREQFVNAIGYLIRRLDENTGPDNFLRHTFRLRVDSDEWRRLEQSFLDSFDQIETVSDAPRRTQDRRQPPSPVMEERTSWREFQNEPDTDFSLLHNVEWAEALIAEWKPRVGAQATEIPLVIAGRELTEDRAFRESFDPSRPGEAACRFHQAGAEDIEAAVACAKQDAGGWRSRSQRERSQILAAVAQQLRVRRADLMGAALLDGGKTLLESDPEVSEAVDFVEFYRRTADDFMNRAGLDVSPKGVVVVVSPWNFPIAIPCGGVAAALAAGNTVILKPASDTVLPAYVLCQCFWEAGVPREALQFAPCPGATVGAQLVAHQDVDVVVLTGGTETAVAMLNEKPGMNLLAETGGKNATIVTSMSDRDQAIKHVLHSAFSHGGQKCSATSLLMLEEEVYEDEEFRRALCDAVESLPVGSAWELHHKMGPLIKPPAGVLEQGLKELETGESWAVMPERLDDNPQLYSPGVKWGVQPGGFTHMTELFGPVLGVMKVKNLSEAIHFVNQTGYGLTSGLESLDDREIDVWLESIRAGNLYVNRPTTGAIVLRQPFGGMGKSAFGPGVKAGGPNYVAQLMNFADQTEPAGADEIADPPLAELHRQLQSHQELRADTRRKIRAAMASYDQNMRVEFGAEHDHFRLVGQDNVRRYRPVRGCACASIRTTTRSRSSRGCAPRAAGCRVTVSKPPGLQKPAVDLLDELSESWGASIEFVEESDEQLAEQIAKRQTDRLRYASAERVPEIVQRASIDVGVFIASAAVLMDGRIELIWCFEEQSVCTDYHRYGNLGERSGEQRAAVA